MCLKIDKKAQKVKFLNMYKMNKNFLIDESNVEHYTKK